MWEPKLITDSRGCACWYHTNLTDTVFPAVLTHPQDEDNNEFVFAFMIKSSMRTQPHPGCPEEM